MSEKTYVGSIGNEGAQYVEAPVKPAVKSGNTKAVKGEDLREGK